MFRFFSLLIVALLHTPVPAQANAHREHTGAHALPHKAHRGMRHKPVIVPKHVAAKPVALDADDEVEEVEAVEPVEAVEAVQTQTAGAGSDAQSNAEPGATATGWTFNKLLAHMHPALVHMPIAWLLGWCACECLSLLWAHPWLATAGLPVGLATVLSFAPAVLSGLWRLDELAGGGKSGYDVGPALTHRNLLFVVWGLVVLAAGVRLGNWHARNRASRFAYVVLVCVACGIAAWSAHLGGNMVYGDDFLPY